MTIKLVLFNFFLGGGGRICDKMAIFAYILKIVENDSFLLRLQIRAKENFNCQQLFPQISNT